MYFYLPTLEEALKVSSENDAFKHKVNEINGKKVYQFNYWLAKHSDFINPVGDPTIPNAFELRGLTFVEQDNGEYKRYLHLHKFFNVNQVPENFLHLLAEKEVIGVSEKLDGSMIRFVEVGGEILAKTKFDFFAPQAKMAQELLKGNFEMFVKETLNRGWAAIFELISPMNRIVLPYNKTELRLLQMRDENTGEYFNIHENEEIKKLAEQYGIVLAKRQSVSCVNTLVEMCETTENEEGWVVVFKDQIVKFKTAWYFSKHRIMTGDGVREHSIIEYTLDEKIDDILSEVPEDAQEIRIFIETISNGIIDWSNKKLSYIQDTAKRIKSEYPIKKDYVKYVQTHCPKEDVFFLIDTYNDPDDLERIEKTIVAFLRKECYRLENAKRFLEKIGVKIPEVHFSEDDDA